VVSPGDGLPRTARTAVSAWSWKAWVALALLAGACGQGSAPPASEAPPNLLLITVDTLRADRLGAYGYADARTPTLDALAREGVLFESAFAPVPRTTQAVASLFTSLHAHEHGVLEIGERLPASAVTLAERLSERGWATAGISANGAASGLQGLDQGFDHFLGIDDLRRRHPLRRSGRPPRPGQIERAQAVTREALQWLASRAEEPWFLWLLYMEPHYRYEPPPAWTEGVVSHRHWFYRAVFPAGNAGIYFDLDGRSSAAREDLSRFYDGEVAFVDSWVGKLLEVVRRRVGGERTLVVFTADHGESLGEHGYFYEHGTYVYQPTVRVPLVVHWPEVVPAGRRVQAPASLLDVAPTAAALLGVDLADAGLSGADLSPAVLGRAPAPERVLFAESGSALHPQAPGRAVGGRRLGRPTKPVFQYVRRGPWVAMRTEDRDSVALYHVEADPSLSRDRSASEPAILRELRERLDGVDILAGRWRMASDGRFKLVRIPELDGVRYALYDLERDPGELRNLVSERPAIAARLRAPLERWTREALAAASAPGAFSSQEEAETRERLRALGYLE